MIAFAPRRRASRRRLQAEIVAMLPAIRRFARGAFHYLRREAREEAVQEAVANAFVAFARLVAQGRRQDAFATVLARFAVAQVRAGRRIGSQLNIRDVLSEYAQCRKHIVVERLDRFDQHEGEWLEAVVEDPRTPILDQVWFRIDFPACLSRLTVRDRRVAQALARGDTTNEVARRFGNSPGRISQLRRELHEDWLAFHGELHERTSVPLRRAA